MKLLPRLAPLAAALLLVACATGSRDLSSSRSIDHALPTAGEAVRVREAFVTAPLPALEIDSVAAWIAPDGSPWLISTAKETHQLVVHDGDSGAFVRTVGRRGTAPGEFDRPNGIAVFADRVFVVERDNHRVQVLSLPDFAPLAMIGADDLRSPYGLWLHETAPGRLELFVTDSFMADFRTETVPPLAELDQRVKRYRVSLDTPVPTAALLGHFGDTTDAGALRMVESIAGDPPQDRLLIAEEDIRVGTTLRVYRMDGTYTGQDLPPRHFRAQAEGVALWSCPDDSGYWITADQSSDRTVFHLFDRRTLDFVGSFAGNQVALTDGIWLHAIATQRFPGGALYAVHDDKSVTAFDLRDVARTLGLAADCVH